MVIWFIIWGCMFAAIATDYAEWSIFMVGVAMLNELIDIEKELKKND